MRGYIELRDPNGPTWYRLRIAHGTWRTPVPQHFDIQRAINGAGHKIVSPACKTWEGVAKVYYAEQSGFISLIMLETLMSTSVAANNRLLLRTAWYGVAGHPERNLAFPVVFANGFDPEYVLPVHDGAGSFFMAPVALQQIGAPVEE